MPDEAVDTGPPDELDEASHRTEDDLPVLPCNAPPGDGPEGNILSGSAPPEGTGDQEPVPEVELPKQQEQAPQATRRPPTNWGPLRRLSSYRRMQREELDYISDRVEKDLIANAQGRLPDGERVELPAVWVTELYTPSTVPGLLNGILHLGWEYGWTRNRSLAKWMSDVREGRSAGWMSLGLVTPAGDLHFMRERTADLPPGVAAALPVLMSVTPSLTALVMAFLMSEESAGDVNAPLRTHYSTCRKRDAAFRRRDVISYVLWGRRLRLGHQIHYPDTIRSAEVRARLDETEQKCTTWVAEHLPGVFASGLRGARLPTAVLFVTEATAPLSEAARTIQAFTGLSIDRDYDAWESAQWPGGRLVLPRSWDDEELRLVFACRRRDAFPEGPGYTSPGSNSAIAQRTDELLRELLVRWGLDCMLDGYHQLLSTLRDRSAVRHSYRPVRDLKALRTLAQTQLYDIVTSAHEIEEFVSSDRAYRYDVLQMEYLREVGGQRPKLVDQLMSSGRTRAQLLQREADLLQSTLSLSNEVTQRISNIRIQRFLLVLAVLSIVIAMAALVWRA